MEVYTTMHGKTGAVALMSRFWVVSSGERIAGLLTKQMLATGSSLEDEGSVALSEVRLLLKGRPEVFCDLHDADALGRLAEVSGQLQLAINVQRGMVSELVPGDSFLVIELPNPGGKRMRFHRYTLK